LPVSRIGCLVPAAPWVAAIVGVPSRAVILKHGDGAAVTIVGDVSDMDARGFAIDGGFGRFSAAAAAELARHGANRAAVAWDGESLRAGGLAEAAGGAAVWDPRGALRSAAADDGIAHRLAEAVEAIAGMVGPERGERAREGIRGDGAFAVAFRRMRAAPGFPASVVGFGPGSTPSGDDWLAGYLTGRDLLEGGPGVAEPGLRADVEAALGRTSAAGRALLLGAVAGAPPAYLAELALASAEGRPGERLRDAVLDALRRGASSGEDALAGFVAAVGSRGGRYDAL